MEILAGGKLGVLSLLKGAQLASDETSGYLEPEVFSKSESPEKGGV